MPRRSALLALLMLAALPAHAEDSGTLHLSCRADGVGAQSAPLAFTINVATKRAVEAASGARYGVTTYRDGLGLWDAEAGPGQIAYRIDSTKGRFARFDAAGRVDGTCEKVEP